MEAAEAWGIPPWQIAGGAPVLWWSRWLVKRNLEIAKIKEKADG
jgi:hypothetical protein